MNAVKAIKENVEESRKDWILWMLERAGKKNGNTKYQFWQQKNHPIELDWIEQKLNYIHNNPVEAGMVREPAQYLYSSARNYAGMELVLEIDSIYDGIKVKA